MSAFSNSKNGIDDLINQFDIADQSLVKFLNDTEYSEKTLENYQKYMQKTGNATSKFGATLKTVAANVGIMLAISVAIKAATWAWDKFDTTVGEAREDLEEGNF